MGFPVEIARAETPACRDLTHLNNAGAALPPPPVLRAVIEHLELEARVGGYEAGDLAAARVDETRAALAELVGAQGTEIALFESGTRAWEVVFRSLALKAGRTVLVSRAEFPSHRIALLQAVKRCELRVECLPEDPAGNLDVEALEQRLDGRVALIASAHVPVDSGRVLPVAEIGWIARRHGVPFLLDACQSVGQMPIDVSAIGCDFLVGAGRKYLRGPRGTGFLYVRDEALGRLNGYTDMYTATLVDESRFDPAPGIRRLEGWERSVAAHVGLGVAARYAIAWERRGAYAYLAALASSLRAKLRSVAGVTVHDEGDELCGIVSFTANGVAPKRLQTELHARRINVRAIGNVARASVHYYNTEAEADLLCDALGEIIR